MEAIYERAEFAHELGSVIVMIDLVVGWHSDPGLGEWARRNDMILHMHRAGHGTYTRQKNHGVSFRVIAKWLRLAGVDHLHAGTAVGKLEGDPMTVQGTTTSAATATPGPDLPRGLFFDQDWADLQKVMPVASGGIHAGQMHQLLDLFGDDVMPAVRRRHDRPPGRASRPVPWPIGSRSKPWSRRGTKASDIRNEGPEILREAARFCTPLRQALDTWGEITFNYTATDTSDYAVTPRGRRLNESRSPDHDDQSDRPHHPGPIQFPARPDR